MAYGKKSGTYKKRSSKAKAKARPNIISNRTVEKYYKPWGSKYASRPIYIPTRNAKLPQFLLAQVNPFRTEVYGVKVPDRNTVPSTTFFTDDIQTQSCDATYKLSAYAYAPIISTYNVAATSASANTWTWAAAFGGGNNTASYADVQSHFQASRAVAHGLKLTCPLAPNNVIGNVHICLYPNDVYNKTTWDYPTSIGQMIRCPGYTKIPLAQLVLKPAIVTNRFMDETAFRYTDPNDTMIANQTSGEFNFIFQWCAVIIVVEAGTASSVNLEVEALCHYEGIAKASASNGTARANASPSNPVAMDSAANYGATAAPVHSEGEDGSLMRQAREELTLVTVRNNPGGHGTTTVSGYFSNYCGLGGVGNTQHATDEACMRHDVGYGVLSNKYRKAYGSIGKFVPYFTYNRYDREFGNDLSNIHPRSYRESIVNSVSRGYVVAKSYLPFSET